MDRNLIDYLPQVLKEVREFRLIFQSKQTEIADLWGSIDNALNDQFVIDATEKDIGRWEKMLKVVPFADDTLETRWFRVQGLWSGKLPYTYRVLLERLDNLCGPDGYVIELNAGEYSLNIKIELTRKRMFDEVARIIRQMVPANIVVTVELRYNQHFTFANFTHGQLSQYTHYQLRNLRNEVFS